MFYNGVIFFKFRRNETSSGTGTKWFKVTDKFNVSQNVRSQLWKRFRETGPAK